MKKPAGYIRRTQRKKLENVYVNLRIKKTHKITPKVVKLRKIEKITKEEEQQENTKM